MLGKLIKYEWKACVRTCIPLYLAVILLALVNRILMGFSPQTLVQSFPVMITGLAYFGVMVAMFVVTFVILIQRFYKNLLGNEGYLMMTLPASITQHIWAKAIVAFIMSVLCGIAATFSIIVLAGNAEMLRVFASIIPGFMEIVKEQPHALLVAIELLLIIILYSFSSILYMYVCMAIGHLAKKHRVAASIGAFFALNILKQIVFSILITAADISNMFGLFSITNEIFAGHMLMIGICIFVAIPGIIYFLATKYILKNKLNLE